MKIRTILLTVAVVLSTCLVPAQIAPFGIRNNDLGPVQSGASDSDSIVQLAADTQGLPAVSPDQIPFSGTFWTIMPGFGFPLPFPCPPPGINLPTYALPDGAFLVDDTATTNATSEADLLLQAAEVTNLIAQAQTVAISEQNHPMARAMGDGLPSPGGGGEGSDVITNALVVPPDYGTNLWIAEPNISANYFGAFASNTISDVEYEIQAISGSDLTQTNWVSQGFFLGSETTNYTPLNGLAVSLTNHCFIRLRSWIDTDGIGIPDWWQIAFFGYVGIDPYGDPMGDGYSNIYKFLHGMNPNIFYPPASPQNLSATYNLTTGTETLTWSPSPGAVTSYTLTVNNEETGQTTTITLSATNTSFTESLAAGSPDWAIPPYGPQINVIYGLQANYGTNGSSVAALSYPEGDIAPGAELVNGPQGRLYYVFQALPGDLSAVRLYRSQQSVARYWADVPDLDDPYFEDNALYAIDYSPIDDGYFEIPAASITNGICELPDSEVPPYWTFNFWVQTVRSNGVESAWTASNPGLNGNLYSASKPFVDARRQLKDNVIFLLRAATPSGPFAFTAEGANAGNYFPRLFTWPNNYVYADFYNNFDNYESSFSMNELPFEDNYFYRNFAFNPDLLTSDGFPNTGCFEEVPTLITNYPAFYFDAASFITATNPAAPSSQLTPALSQWILPSGSGGTTFDGSPVAEAPNCYGLPVVSVEDAWITNNQIVSGTFYPGENEPNGVGGVRYVDSAQPQFLSDGYYFARPNVDPLPEQSGFSLADTTPTMFAGVGNSLTVAGYNELAVTNGYPGVYAYLGQYFDQAYQINTNAVVTSDSAGVLSPYGVFTPTVPGPAALVTMPDIDTGERGTCAVDVVSLQLDANHDGTMDLSFNGTDATSPSNPMKIWINDGNDGTGVGEDIDIEGNTNLANYTYGQIRSERNLENFFRLWICGLPSWQTFAGCTFTLSMTPSSGNPAINLYPAYDTSGSTSYLTDTNIAAGQISTAFGPNIPGGVSLGTINATQSYTVPMGDYETPRFTRFLFEGAGIGSGQLTLTISQSNNVVAQTSVWLDIHHVKDLYQRVLTTPRDPNGIPAPYVEMVTFDETTAGVDTTNDGYAFSAPADEDKSAVVFVHGSNISLVTAIDNGETMFKRLYWQGYNGRFVLFYWDTLIGPFHGGFPANYDYNEYRAFKYGLALKNYVENQLPAGYTKNVIGHSMGNMLIASALYPRTNLDGSMAPGMTVSNVIFMQAAVPASCFDPDATTLPALAALESPQTTPDYFSQMGYRGMDATNVNATLYNMYNPNDYALGWWVTSQKLNKPDDLMHPIPYSNQYYEWSAITNGSLHNWIYDPEDLGYDIPGPEIRPVTDPQESISFIARSRTAALGTLQTDGSILDGNNFDVGPGTTVNLGTLRPDHSGEFTRTIQQLYPFYRFIFEQVR